jgi:hypothetical protein
VEERRTDRDRLSFVHTLRIVRRAIPLFQNATVHASVWYAQHIEDSLEVIVAIEVDGNSALAAGLLNDHLCAEALTSAILQVADMRRLSACRFGA